jgi:hypothetical protein
MTNKAVTVRFPAPLPAEIPCPICDGNKCNVCNKTGRIEITVDAKVPIQRNLIVQYVVENMDEIAFEIGKTYGLVPNIQTEDMFNMGDKTYEIVKLSSLGGVVWIANRVDELESPRYFKSYKSLADWKGGMGNE